MVSNLEKYFKVADFLNSIDSEISIIGVLDRDYYPDSYLNSIKEIAEDKNRLRLHIWAKKK